METALSWHCVINISRKIDYIIDILLPINVILQEPNRVSNY